MHVLGALLVPFLGVAAAAAAAAATLPVSPFFSDRVMYVPAIDYNAPGTLYARTVELSDGTLLATWENYSPQPPLVYYPIFRSLDGGQSWTHFSNVTDQVNGWGMRYQPFLYELEQEFGGFAPGTILCAGNSIPANLSNTQIDLYASRDRGYTWEFVSHIAAGGEALPDDGLTPVWEPFILLYRDQLVVFYSDQRDPAHGQKLSHQTSTNLRTWSAPVDDVAYADYSARPGMTMVTLLPNGSYMMTYEYGGGPGFADYSFPVYYRINDSPLEFNNSVGYPIVVGSTHPQSSPYVTWSALGGLDGTIIVSCGVYPQIFVNRALGDAGAWEMYNVSQPSAYTRHLRVFREDPNKLLIMGAGSASTVLNNVSLSVVDLSSTIGLLF